jgi:GR25 family glycosyltransferase involved in LPS biosynthesis
MKIFVIHYKKLIERKNHILEQFEKYNITEYEFIDIDRDELDGYDLTKFENLPNSYMAIGLSHLYAYNEIKNNYDEALILEDDVIFCDNFMTIFNNYLKQLPKDYDMCFYGSCYHLHIEPHNLIPNKNIYEKSLENGSTRTIHCYMVSKKCAIKVCDYFDNIKYKINMATDMWLNIVARDINLKMYWAEPTISMQGSDFDVRVFNKSYTYINN